jgi:hypothetical protein
VERKEGRKEKKEGRILSQEGESNDFQDLF